MARPSGALDCAAGQTPQLLVPGGWAAWIESLCGLYV